MTEVAIIRPQIYISGQRCEVTYRKPGGRGQSVGFGEWGITLDDDGTLSDWSGWFTVDKRVGLLSGPVCRFVGFALVPSEPSLLLRTEDWRWTSQVFGVIRREDAGGFSGVGYLIIHDPWVLERARNIEIA